MYKATLKFRVFLLKCTLIYIFWNNALYTFLCECLILFPYIISETMNASTMRKLHLTTVFGISVQGHLHWENVFFSTNTLNNILVKIRCFFNFVSGFRLVLILMTTSHS